MMIKMKTEKSHIVIFVRIRKNTVMANRLKMESFSFPLVLYMAYHIKLFGYYEISFITNQNRSTQVLRALSLLYCTLTYRCTCMFIILTGYCYFPDPGKVTNYLSLRSIDMYLRHVGSKACHVIVPCVICILLIYSLSY